MLTLPIAEPWFSMIKGGEKKEEYRKMTDYYRTRFHTVGLLDEGGYPIPGKSANILLRNGYGQDRPSILCTCSLTVGSGRQEWGAEPGEEYYILKIHAMTNDLQPTCNHAVSLREGTAG